MLVVVVVGSVVGRQWQVHWAASGQLSSVNPTTTRPLSTPMCPPTSHGAFLMDPRKVFPTQLLPEAALPIPDLSEPLTHLNSNSNSNSDRSSYSGDVLLMVRGSNFFIFSLSPLILSMIMLMTSWAQAL